MRTLPPLDHHAVGAISLAALEGDPIPFAETTVMLAGAAGKSKRAPAIAILTGTIGAVKLFYWLAMEFAETARGLMTPIKALLWSEFFMIATSPPLLITSGAARLSGRRLVSARLRVRRDGSTRLEAARRCRRFTIGREAMRTMPVFPPGGGGPNRVLASEGSIR